METFSEFVKTGECRDLVRKIYGTRELPPEIQSVLSGEYESDDLPGGKLGEFIEKIRREGIFARGYHNEASEASNAAQRIIYRANF